MRLQSARDLKSELLETVVRPAMSVSTLAASAAKALAARALPIALNTEAATVGVAAAAFDALPKVNRSIALGITKRGQEHQLAVRVQRQSLLRSPLLEHIIRSAHGEADVRLIGRLEKRAQASRARKAAAGPAVLWYRGRVRPLLIGSSIGHVDVTAGTLGAFVRRGTRRFVLSNNHVLANEDEASRKDLIVQPGRLDGGSPPDDAVGELDRWIRLKSTASNLVDAAIATLYEPDDCDPTLLRGITGADGKLAGLGPDFLDEGTLVYKVGRTTGATAGRVTAFDMDNVVVQYDRGNLRFSGQIEIEGAGENPFSAGGDSGSLIVDQDMMAVGLLFAGGDTGGSNGLGLTYANPIHTVLTDLNVQLVY